MPRDITHVILADEAAKIIESQAISNHPEAFHMGCLADDSFLYSLSPQLSSKLHGAEKVDTRAIILAMMDDLDNEKKSSRLAEKKAFIYGFLCHMAADVAFHPLIYSISGAHQVENDKQKKMLAKACHRYAETWLDLHFMREKNLSFKNFRPFRKIITNLPMRMRLDDFFTDSLQNVLKAKKYTWGDNFDLQAQFHCSMIRQLFVNKITQNQTIAGVLRKLDRVLHGKLKLYTSGFYDFSKDVPQRLTAGSFIHPVTGERINKSIKDLEQDAVTNSVQYIQAADNYISSKDKEAFCQAVRNFNCDTGMENSTPKDFSKTITPDWAAMEGKVRKRRSNVLNPLNLKHFCKKSR